MRAPRTQILLSSCPLSSRWIAASNPAHCAAAALWRAGLQYRELSVCVPAGGGGAGSFRSASSTAGYTSVAVRNQPNPAVRRRGHNLRRPAIFVVASYGLWRCPGKHIYDSPY